MTALDGSHHRMIVFDNRQVPGDTVDFPAVRLFFRTTDHVHSAMKHTVHSDVAKLVCAKA